VALVLTPVAILVARRQGFVKAVRDRDIHVRPTPDIGGFVLFAAFATAAWWTAAWSTYTLPMIGLGALAVVIFAVDDRRPIQAWIKLGAQALLAVIAVSIFSRQFAIAFFTVPHFGLINLAPVVAVPISILWLLGMENTVNFLDGVDGLAAGVVGIVALILLVAASTRGPQAMVMLTAALAGACGGFLVFNFSPARIFMGDSGSNFLGLMIGLMSVAGVAKVAAAFSLLIPVFALAVPIADTAWAIVRRRREGVSIAHPDTRHIHHQLLDFGLTQGQICVVFYCSAAILGSFGLMIYGHRRVLAVTITLLVVVISTMFGELLQRSALWLPVPGLRRLRPSPPPRIA
jgi:UDP-GlcNAc:undecaprenyl-phosphate/decaprenyl-phosphate GlcNAc-1-phosphate transferase